MILWDLPQRTEVQAGRCSLLKDNTTVMKLSWISQDKWWVQEQCGSSQWNGHKSAIMQRGSTYGQMSVRLWIKTAKLDVILVYEWRKRIQHWSKWQKKVTSICFVVYLIGTASLLTNQGSLNHFTQSMSCWEWHIVHSRKPHIISHVCKLFAAMSLHPELTWKICFSSVLPKTRAEALP